MAESSNQQFSELIVAIRNFNAERDWSQFHNPKDLAISLSLEASELLEHFQWKDNADTSRHIEAHKQDVAAELADVFYWVLLIADTLNIDIAEALKIKMQHNAKKYPIDKVRSKHHKYTEYE